MDTNTWRSKLLQAGLSKNNMRRVSDTLKLYLEQKYPDLPNKEINNLDLSHFDGISREDLPICGPVILRRTITWLKENGVEYDNQEYSGTWAETIEESDIKECHKNPIIRGLSRELTARVRLIGKNATKNIPLLPITVFDGASFHSIRTEGGLSETAARLAVKILEENGVSLAKDPPKVCYACGKVR